MPYCTQCGNYISDEYKFCPYCGCSQLSNVVQPIQYPSEGPNYKVFAVIAVAAMLIVGILAAPYVLDLSNESYDDKSVKYTWTSASINKELGDNVEIFEMDFTISGSAYLSQKKAKVDRDGTADQNKIKNYVIVDETITDLSQKLYSKYIEFVNIHPSLNTDVFFSDYIVGFVNCVIDYELDIDSHNRSEYWALPVETMYLGKGDCEDTSILAASIFYCLSSMDGAKNWIKGTTVLTLPAHAMVGVQISSTIPGGQIVLNPDVLGKRYYVCETTGHFYSFLSEYFYTPCVTGGQLIENKVNPNELSGESLLQTHFEILYLN